MATIQTQKITITLSKLLKGDAKPTGELVSVDFSDQIEALVSELIEDSSVVVEVESEGE